MADTKDTSFSREQRKVLRRHLVFYLRVFDGMSTRVLGHLADISSRGIMLVCEAPVQENEEFRLRMRLPREIAGRSEIVLDATCRWCRPDTNPEFYIAGFQVVGLEREFEELITRLVEDFSVEETGAANDSERPACNLTHTRR